MQETLVRVWRHADRLGLPAGTVRSRMCYALRALRALRLALQERGVSEPFRVR